MGRTRGRLSAPRAVLTAVAAVVLLTVVAVPIAAEAAGSPQVRPQQLAPGSAPTGSRSLGSVPGTQPVDLSIVLAPSMRISSSA